MARDGPSGNSSRGGGIPDAYGERWAGLCPGGRTWHNRQRPPSCYRSRKDESVSSAAFQSAKQTDAGNRKGEVPAKQTHFGKRPMGRSKVSGFPELQM